MSLTIKNISINKMSINITLTESGFKTKQELEVKLSEIKQQMQQISAEIEEKLKLCK